MSNLENRNKLSNYDIAIIGMSGRFPQAHNLDVFWQHLRDGVESISFFSEQNMMSEKIDATMLSDTNYVKAGAVLENIELFDATFFGYSAREADIIDPQQRLFLESAWEALEYAGYDSQNYQGRISIYGGATISSYLLFNIFSNPELIKLVGLEQIGHINSPDNLTTRIAYHLNLKGPAITVQTACSTSLVAVHLACQSLLDLECDMALAGGVSVYVLRDSGYLYQEGGILSPDGHCRAFDAKAKGTVGGNGLGIVVLKRLADAIADRDCIHAVIKGSAVNNDGSLKVGYTAPSVNGQAKAIAEALAVSRVAPETVSYIEAHGTGTILGDPIEIASLTKCFRASTNKKNFCAIGSVKTNIGHLDAAAGVAGLIKTTLALKHKQIPPSLHFEQPNPQIDFANSPFYVNDQLSEWKSNGYPRRAGVNSFGIGGTNAHVILEEAPNVENFSSLRPYQLLILSAKTSSALSSAKTNLVNHLKQHPNLNLADVAYTLGVGRRAFEHRQVVVCQDLKQTIQVLENPDHQRVISNFVESSLNKAIVFMFPGQGTQYVGMGRELYETEPIFREQFDYCCELLKPHLELDLRQVIYPQSEQLEQATQQLTQTAIAQPALFAIKYALAKLWMSWGVHPEAMIGHSIGEYVAACLAGVFSVEDALAIVAVRGQLMQQLPNGAMLAVPLSELQLQPLLGKELSIAAINSPSMCVVSGATAAIEDLKCRLTEQNVDFRLLHTSGAFHSQMMDAIADSFIAQVKKLNLKAPQIHFISNLTGTWITTAQAVDPNYWAKHLRQTVRFAQGIAELSQQSNRILLEVGPGHTLSTLARQNLAQSDQQNILSSLRHPQEQKSDIAFLLDTLGKLWLAGAKIDWNGFYATERRHRIPLPTYPFERQKYWIEPVTSSQQLLHKKPNVADWFYIPCWKQSILLEPLVDEKLKEQKSCWLVFIDECGVGIQFAKRLEQADQEVVTVTRGDRFNKLSNRAYCINPQHISDYEALFQDLQALDKTPQRIAHLWSMTSNEQTASEIDIWEANQTVGFYSLLFLAQVIGEQGITDAIQIIVITNKLHDVIGNESLSPTKATILGCCKVIPQEYPNITCRSIDIVISESGQENLIDKLIGEFLAKSTDLVVAYRSHHRWIKSFTAVRLEEANPPQARLRQQGVYLITGGLGGIGLVLAEYLAQTVQAKLVLLGRSHLPIRDQWSQWLTTHDPQDSISQKITKIQALEKLGAEVLVSSADVTNSEQMQALKIQVSDRFGAIHGVIHAAGIAGGGIIQLKTPAAAASVLAAKVKGTLVIDATFKNEKLDFLVLCSSLSSILGGFGQVDYCAANAFLNEFAYRNFSKQNSLTISINWCGWQDVGMLVNTAVPKELKKRREQELQTAISPQEGVEVFSRILNSGIPQIAVSTQDFLVQIEQSYSTISLEAELADLEAELVLTNYSSPTHPRPNLRNDYVSPRTELEQTIANIWQQLLGIEQVGIDDNFFELGGHSLLATQVISRLRKTFPVELPLLSLFSELSTIANLAEAIEQLLIKKLEELSDEEVQHFLKI